MEKLTPQEEEAMRVIWAVKTGFIKDFLSLLSDPKPPYTTFASTVRNLEKKGYLESEKLGNSYRFTAIIKEEDYKKKFISDIVSGYFKNSYKELVAFFAQQEKINADELKEIVKMIEKPKSE